MVKGSIDKFLAEMMRKEKNALNLIKMYSEILSTKDEKLIIEYLEENGNLVSFEIPSVAYILASIKRIEKNFENLASVGILQANLLFPDGTRRAIITQNLPTEPLPIEFSLSQIGGKFNAKEIDIVSQFISPRTFITFDIQKFIDVSCKKVTVKKINVFFDTIDKKVFFENSLKGKTFSYKEITDILKEKFIDYNENHLDIDVEPRIAKNSGYFDVLNIVKEEVKSISNGIEKKSNKLYYSLNKLTYKNNENDSDVNLKIGDELIVNNPNGVKNTVYTIETIDYSTNKVSLIRIEGIDRIEIGTNKVMINPKWDEKINVNIPILSNEYFIPFIKPIQDSHSLISTDWGKSQFVVTNDLVLYNDPAMKFSTYFEDNVSDLKSGLENIKESGSIPVSSVVKPNAPLLDVENFTVKMINSHKISTIEALTKEKYAEKETVKSSINALDESITNLKNKLSQTTQTREKEKLTKEIDEKYKSRKNLVSNFASLISDITSIIKDSNQFTPKYRIRGFFDIPEGQYTDRDNKLGLQEIIKFECEYRYLRKDSTENSTDTMTYKDASGNEIKASYSNWNQVLTLRQRTKKYNVETKKLEWENEDLLNPEIINVNQIDIPISEGEAVEIRVRSISEVGYPTVITYSDWSESVIMEFPKELTSTTNSMLKEIGNDQFLTTIEQELTSLGVYDHLNDSFISGDKLYHHSAKNIATDYYTNENKQMSAAQVIEEMKQTIERIESQYSISSTKLEIYIVDESGTKIADVNNNDTITLFAGYYKNLMKGNNSKGEIVTKMYYLCIKNPKATDVELLSYVPGMYDNRLPKGDYTDYVSNKYEYDSYRRYFDVPVSYRGIVENDDYVLGKINNDNPFIELPPFTSSQVKGQYIYSRYNDITLSNPLYIEPNDGNNGYDLVQMTGGSNNESFIFAGFDKSSGTPKIKSNGSLTDFCVHINHPYIQNLALADDLYDQTTFVPKNTVINKKAPFIFLGQSKLASIESGAENYYKQLAYKPYVKVTNGSAKAVNFPRKIGFNTFDKYLIGNKTCGAYLFLAPNLPKSLYTGSNIYNKGVVINNSEVRIPIIFQCRMTDYYGEGDTGIGRIGGDPTKSNLFYSKKIGLDILQKNQDLFSFDLSVEMQYQQNV